MFDATLIDNVSDVEYVNIRLHVLPRIGEVIHYWEDKFPKSMPLAEKSIDYKVEEVHHDYRVMSPHVYIHSVVLYVTVV